LLAIVNRYLDRIGRRLAYYDSFEQLPNAKKVIEKTTVDENAKAVMREITGANQMHEPTLNAAAGLIKSLMLGPITGLNDLANSVTLGFQHQQNLAQSVKAGMAGWKNIKQGWQDSFDSGRNRMNFNALEWNEADDITANLRRLRDVAGEASGRNLLEKVTRARTAAEGRYVALDYLGQQAKGKLSKQGLKFFNDFGKDVNWKSGKLSNEELLKVIGRYVDSVQGTYDARGTDFRVREGQLAPLFSLSRWSIEKLNNFDKHVVQPATKGNFTPLLMSTLGMFIGGSAVNYIREMMSGRKGKTADWSELKAASEQGADVKPELFYKLVTLASAGAYAGMGSDAMKALMDTAYGKTKAQGPNIVWLEFAENVIQNVVSATKGAIDNGLTPELFVDVVSQALEDNIQAWRVGMAHLSGAKKEDIERANKMRDLRTFNRMEGNPITDLSIDFIKPMGNAKEKTFKRTDDLREAAELLPSLLQEAVEKAGNNPDLLRKELTSLKQNSYQTMPNPDRMPTTFLRYLLHLKKSQGVEQARARLQDYIQQNAVNKAKAEMVP
jgi:hypothetical protein